MVQCPQCHSEVKAGERFCANCGARIETAAPPVPPEATNPPPARTGRETILLPPTPAQPNDATLIAGSPTPPSPAAAETSRIGDSAGVPPNTPFPGGSVPAGAVPPAPPAKSGNGVWKVLAIIAGIGVVLCLVLSIGAYIALQRFSSAATNVIATANAGGTFATISAGLATAAAEPTDEALPEETPVADDQPTAAAGGDQELLYSENFDTASADGFDEDSNEHAAYAFVDGGYAISVKSPNWLTWAPLKGDYGDASVSVDTTMTGPEKNGASVLFHFQDKENFYVFTVAGDGSYNLDMYKDDKATTLIEWTESPAIKGPDQLNTLRVETVGDTIRLFANDTLLDEISDSTFTSGKIALAVNSFDEPNTKVVFDNVEVRSIK